LRPVVAVLAACAAILAAAVILESREPNDAPRVPMCPSPHISRVFGDFRDLCASRATALATVDGAGRLTAFVDEIECVPSFRVKSEESTRLIGHGDRRCDTHTVGATLFVFPHCSLTMNYPGNEGYRAALPIGLLVEPYGC
jgi:hypothetical protein